ncbi:cytosolic Fe-S cluster assembly factor NBP35 [Senna tora]|uniref:Cytosolic Fe-S cluster assembly factor NBP35 n=1 Tax=Senna tora TaxID=362788 RepID=A0A834WP66_9FABA|nr:cytosolic Fe-S cluster assembly factor NBP35 [Senna tora]
MSIGFTLSYPDEPLIWTGTHKSLQIKHFLKDVYWEKLDFLVIDTPPGTSDEHITIVKCLEATGIDGAIIVTTPQQVSLVDVRKGVNFCKEIGVKILGVLENMSGLCQPFTDFKFMEMTDTGDERDVSESVREYLREKAPEMLNLIAFSEVFDSSGGGAAKMCNEMGVPFLGKVPLDPQLCKVAEKGQSCFVDKDCCVSASALKKIIEKLMESIELPISPNSDV